MNRFRARAFTLLEVMIVVGLVAILTSLAYASYSESVRKSNRGNAQAALTGFASAMQRYYTEQTPSTFIGATAIVPGAPNSSVYASQAPIDGAKKHYNLTIQSASATAYELRAAPISGTDQANDKCGTLTLTSTGQRGITGGDTGVVWTDCWR